MQIAFQKKPSLQESGNFLLINSLASAPSRLRLSCKLVFSYLL